MSNPSAPRTRRKRSHPLKLALVFALFYFGADYALNNFAFSAGWTILWPLNGVTIALLLRNRRRSWPAILIGVAIGTGIGEYFDDNSLTSEIWQRFFSVTEVVISASLLPAFVSLDRWLRTPHIFFRFVTALLLGPGISGAMAAIYFHLAQGLPYLLGFNNWATADALGIAATLPLTLALRSPEMLSLFRGRATLRTACVSGLALAAIAVVFSTSRYPLLFVLYPTLLFADSLLAFPGTALIVAGTCLIAVYSTTHGWGPFGHWPSDLIVPRDLGLQIFLGFHIVALFPASLLFMERRRMTEKLRVTNARLQRLASLDGLTSIANRRALDEQFELEWKRETRAQTSLALLMIDIDHFKQFNDIYGHAAGDNCLQTVARELARCMRRPEDFLARYGGEEFAVLLPHTDLDGALTVAAILRAAIAELAIEHSASPSLRLTVSIGCAACVPLLSHGRAELLHMADSALYQAKRSGRNRMEAAPCPQQVLP